MSYLRRAFTGLCATAMAVSVSTMAMVPNASAEEVSPAPVATELPVPEAPIVEPTTTPTAATPAEPSAEPTSTPAVDQAEPGSEDEPTDQPAVADPPSGRLMIVGDSISYVPSGSVSTDPTGGPGYSRDDSDPARPKAWWAYLADYAGIDPIDVVADAVPTTGMTFGGVAYDPARCVDRGFNTADRLEKIRRADPTVLVIAGGRNDFKACTGGVVTISVSDESLVAGFSSYLDEIADIASASDDRLEARHVYVAAPWGSRVTTQRAQVTEILEREVTARGFTWIMTPQIPDSLTRASGSTRHDRTHPDAVGARWLALQIRAGSDVVDVLKGNPNATVRSGIKVVCGTSAWCTYWRLSDGGYYAKRRSSFWGRNPGGDASNYVAYRATRGRGSSYPDGAATPATWLDAVRGSSTAVIVATPAPGDIAWWPTAPSGVRGNGHVAVVQKRINTYSVQVSEVTGPGGRHRATIYSGQNLPRAYLRLGSADGTPEGRLGSVTSASHNLVTVRGFAYDPDAYDKGTKLRVRVYQGSRTYTSGKLTATRFGFHRNIPVKGLKPGVITVRVYAYNASKSRGTSRIVVGTSKTTLR